MLKPHFHYGMWGKDRALAEWQQLFGEDVHSQVVPVSYWCSHDGFKLKNHTGLDIAALPDIEVVKDEFSAKPDEPRA